MKRFIVTVLSVSVFFIGLGNLIEKAGASFKSDEKALALLSKARAAVGGDTAIASVKSMTITGKATKTFEVEGVARNEQGDVEINFELPNKMNKNIRIGSGDGEKGMVERRADVLVMRQDGGGGNIQWKTVNPDETPGVKRVIVKKDDGSTEELNTKEPIIIRKGSTEKVDTETGAVMTSDGNKVFVRRTDGVPFGGEQFRSNELLRTTLSLLLSAPEGLDVSYTYVGEGSVDGNSCDIVAANDGGSTIKLYLDKSTSLPRMMTFEGHKPFMIKLDTKEALPGESGDTKIFTRKIEAPEPDMAEFQVKFSDYRSVNGLQLPHKWTQTIAGKDDEVIEVTSFVLNPANIADKFKEMPTQVFFRTQKDQ